MISELVANCGIVLAHCFNVPGAFTAAKLVACLEFWDAQCTCGAEAPGFWNFLLKVPNAHDLGLTLFLAHIDFLHGGKGVTSSVPIH